jgi:hypothetical protein
LKAKILSQKIIQCNLEGIKDAAIDNLIIAFGGQLDNLDIMEELLSNNKNENLDNSNMHTNDNTLNSEIELLRLELERNRLKVKELIQENNTLKQLTLLTNNSNIIEVSDEDINELYVRYLVDGTTQHGTAFVVDGLIPKKYYKL